jgi:hypothetical protein
MDAFDECTYDRMAGHIFEGKINSGVIELNFIIQVAPQMHIAPIF